ncbi:MAG: NYN domain-containing protein [Prevotella sp.]|nr:NYN domain-containing protein [Prevotella sp.]
MKMEEVKEDDVYFEIRQKGIDMKIGVDIASLALKRFVDCIVLFSGDSDFVPAAKLARREWIDFVLDPMHANVEPQLFEHVDGMKSVNPYINKNKYAKQSLL